ncbi:MAG TPA: hypothetical protein VF268_06320, partial [Gammaproteobacteria bacterium]
MNKATRRYGLTLAVGDSLLLAIARIIGAEYMPGSFERAVEALYETDNCDAEWELRGRFGLFKVWIERGDSIFHCTLSAQEPRFQAGKELMWNDYIAGGGNPL